MIVSDRRIIVLVSALLVAGAISPAHADNENEREDDHEQAIHALEQGQVRALADILTEIDDELGGKIVGVEFERRGGRYIYEFKVLTAGGSLREVFVDAASAEILSGGED